MGLISSSGVILNIKPKTCYGTKTERNTSLCSGHLCGKTISYQIHTTYKVLQIKLLILLKPSLTVQVDTMIQLIVNVNSQAQLLQSYY